MTEEINDNIEDNNNWELVLDTNNVTKSITIYDEDTKYTRFPRYVDPREGINDGSTYIDTNNVEKKNGNPEYFYLANLRTFKSSNNIIRTREGRSDGKNITFNDFSYETRKERRKFEVLQYKNTGLLKNNWKDNFKSKRISQSQLKLLKEKEKLSNCDYDINGINIKDIPFENSL